MFLPAAKRHRKGVGFVGVVVVGMQGVICPSKQAPKPPKPPTTCSLKTPYNIGV